MPYEPGPDVITVMRAPKRTAARGTYRAFGETLRGLRTTFKKFVETPQTIQYPEEKVPVYPRFRGRHAGPRRVPSCVHVRPHGHRGAFLR